MEQDRRRFEQEVQAAHVAAQQAEAEALNVALAERNAELDGLLAATLEVDDFVDLERLRRAAHHPPFDKDYLRNPVPLPSPMPDPPAPARGPVRVPLSPFGREKKVAESKAAIEAQYANDYARWQDQLAANRGIRERQMADHAAAERRRHQQLAEAVSQYERECAQREQEVLIHSAELDQFIVELGYGTVDAVQEYVGIVLANSVYPESFPVTHAAAFESSSAELSLRVAIPGPDIVPRIKGYRYVKSNDEITTSPATQKDLKERYLRIVHDLALRSLHEVFEADRRGLIQSISLELGTNSVLPATGRETYVPLVAVATQREVFEQLNLSAIVPAATLEHLGAVISKNPYGLVAVNPAGVRRA